MLVLGSLAAVLLTVESPKGSSSNGAATTFGLDHPPLVVNATAVAACRTSYTLVQEAVDEFEYDTGTGATSMNQLQGFLHGPVSTPQYTISIDRSLAGEIDVATPGHPASPGDSNCAYAGP